MTKARRLDDALRAHLLERLSHRAARLASVASQTHPGSKIDGIIALMAEHVTNTAIVLLGDVFARQVLERVFDALTEDAGICRFCRARPLREDGTMCQVCWDQAASDDEITEDQLIALGLDDGGADEPAASPAPEASHE